MPTASLLLPALVLLAGVAPALHAQTSLPPNQATNFHDPSLLKPPSGAKVAVIEYEDLECPFCAHAFPFVHMAVNRYHVPLEEFDFQIPGHAWSHQAAIFAHYLKAKVSPQLSEEFRREVFATQSRIASLDDLHKFEVEFMQRNGKAMPAVVDPTGAFDREVNDSTAQGVKLGVVETPTILVVTPDHWIQVKDVDEMDKAIEEAEAEASHSSAAGVKAAPAHR